MSDCYAGVEAMNRMTKERLAELEKFAERLPPTDQINSRLIEAINALKAERAKVAELSRGEPCAVCGGAPNPSGLRCICDDTGRLSVAEFNARSQLITTEAQLAALREGLEGLTRYQHMTYPGTIISPRHEAVSGKIPGGVLWVKHAEIEALLTQTTPTVNSESRIERLKSQSQPRSIDDALDDLPNA